MLIAKPVRGPPSINRSEHPWQQQIQVADSRSGYGIGGHQLVFYFLWLWAVQALLSSLVLPGRLLNDTEWTNVKGTLFPSVSAKVEAGAG